MQKRKRRRLRKDDVKREKGERVSAKKEHNMGSRYESSIIQTKEELKMNETGSIQKRECRHNMGHCTSHQNVNNTTLHYTTLQNTAHNK